MNKYDRAILIAGLGSVGRRHLRNLKSAGYKNILFYRSGKGFSLSDEESNISVESNLRAALAKRPIAVIVSNSTSMHMPVALAAARAGCHLFIEKPISHNFNQVRELEEQVKKYGLIVLVGFQFRFHPALQKIKQWLNSGIIGKVFSVTAHWGEYLPHWHPNEDYRKGYSARKDMGGGVVSTLCHPFDYLRWLIGEVSSVCALTGKLSNLEIDVEDNAEVLLRFSNGAVGSVHLDYLERPGAHWLSIIGEKGAIRWNNSDGKAHIYKVGNSKWKSFSPPGAFERNSMFATEMRHFLNCISVREKPVCTLKDGIQALKIALAVKKSAREKKEIKL